MNCLNHPENETTNACTLCGRDFCSACLVELGEKFYCRACLEHRVATDQVDSAARGSIDQIAAADRDVKQFAAERKSRFWALVLSLIPGVGYMYLGLMNRGLQTMVLFFGSVFVTSFIGFEELMALVAPVVVFYSIFDTQQMLKKLNEGAPVEDRLFFDIKSIPFNQSWLGYGLLIIGILALLHNIPYFPFWMTFKRFLPPLMIIGLGVWILFSTTRKNDNPEQEQ